jgi:phosphonoacetate hydrolase
LRRRCNDESRHDGDRQRPRTDGRNGRSSSCVDGCEPDYVNQAITASAPWLAALDGRGTSIAVRCAIVPNPNTIVTGRPPSVHGICGNYFFDDAGAEVMMNDRNTCAPARSRSIRRRGREVAVITAKTAARAAKHRLRGVCFGRARRRGRGERHCGRRSRACRLSVYSRAVGCVRGRLRC